MSECLVSFKFPTLEKSIGMRAPSFARSRTPNRNLAGTQFVLLFNLHFDSNHMCEFVSGTDKFLWSNSGVLLLVVVCWSFGSQTAKRAKCKCKSHWFGLVNESVDLLHFYKLTNF